MSQGAHLCSGSPAPFTSCHIGKGLDVFKNLFRRRDLPYECRRPSRQARRVNRCGLRSWSRWAQKAQTVPRWLHLSRWLYCGAVSVSEHNRALDRVAVHCDLTQR
jgi:hypothetical protein